MSSGCKTHARPSQHHPNPAPGSTPEAAAAAKNDAAKRDGGVVGVMKRVYDKIVASTPAPNATPQSSAAMADKKDQAAKMTPDAK
jgi:hypothetical protein